ncbi:MAG: RluA family pseudouridine synthase [Spirochaetia bacterium]|nr:RluA family pseudouridine synthase [Spirochaetia bacterium]
MEFKTVATVKKDDDGKRCDRIFRIVLGEMPLSRIYREIRSGFLRINGRRTKQDARVAEGDTVDVAAPLMEFVHTQEPKKTVPTINRGAFQKRIIYEDDNILILNKKKGELVHPDGKSGSFTTLDRIVKDYLGFSREDSIAFAPGPLHRLDRNTSGMIAFGKTAQGARDFSMALQNRETRKCYIALLDGTLSQQAMWHDRLLRDNNANYSQILPLKSTQGDEVITIATPFLCSNGLTLAQVEIKTGRTHQIRAQASYHKHPLTGDLKYHGSPNDSGYYLHSCCIIADGKAYTGMPGQDFITDISILMCCSKNKVISAIENTIASFAGETHQSSNICKNSPYSVIETS